MSANGRSHPDWQFAQDLQDLRFLEFKLLYTRTLRISSLGHTIVQMQPSRSRHSQWQSIDGLDMKAHNGSPIDAVIAA